MEVQGKDALIYFNIDGTYKEYGCAENITVDSIAEIIETSTVGSGVDRDFDYQSKTKTISLTGLVLNDDPTMITVWDLYNQQENFLTTNFRIVFTDVAGNIKTMAGSVIFPQISWSADQTDLASSTIQMQTTGGITLSEDAVVPIITIEVVGSGSGQIQSITLTDPVTLASWTLTGPITGTETWVLDGMSGRPGAGAYYVEASVASMETTNTFSTDAPPTASTNVGIGGTILNTTPWGNNVQFDFTTNRTITFDVSPSANVPPVAEAGADQTITLPTDTVTVDGSGSSDSDGTISSYLWSYVSGPASYTIVTSTSVSTIISGLDAGTYVFRLTVTDNDGATDTDDITITVNPVTPKIYVEVTGTGTGQIDSIFLVVPGGAFYFPDTIPITAGAPFEWLLDGLGSNPVPGNYRIVASVTSNQATNTFSTDAAPTGSVGVAGPVTMGSVGAPFGDPGTTFTFTGGETITFNLGS